MIQITNNDIESVCEWYWGEIKPRIQKSLTRYSSEINAFCVTKQTSNTDISSFINKELDSIITSKPEELLNINKRWVEAFCKYDNGKNLLDDYKLAQQASKKKGDEKTQAESVCKKTIKHFNYFQKIFNYKETVLTDDIRYELSQRLGVKVCPYCNRNYTLTINNKKGVDATGVKLIPDFDHFFAKSMYPILALSFYNLIPSCAICNRNLKGPKEFSLGTHCHPYLEGFGTNATFQYNPKSVNQALGIDDCCEIKLDIEPNTPKDMRKKIDGNIEVFGLNGIYSEHGDIVAEIITKYYKTNGKYLDSLEQLFDGKVSSSELYRLAFGNYEEEADFGKRPMAKLTSDIVKQLKLDKRFR